jgi:patatin-like phospholipase/acyl hydrolase
MARKILQIDGGGLKGVIPAVVLDNFEKVIGKPCCKIFDLITGTSTGAIIGGALAAGITPASEIRRMYVQEGPKLFTPRVPLVPFAGILFGGSKYDRKPFIEKIKAFTGNKRMDQAETLFMATTMNLCSGRTHFIYSNDKYEGCFYIWQVVSWSALSAPAYFGKINEPDFFWDDFLPGGTVVEDIAGGVFQDGGQGINNCTLGAATVASIAKRWFDEEVIILSLGCGDYHKTVPYARAAKTGLIGQVTDYLSQARNEAAIMQYSAARCLSITRKENYTLVRINCALPKNMDMLDGVKWIKEYENIGEQLKDSIPFELFEDPFEQKRKNPVLGFEVIF